MRLDEGPIEIEVVAVMAKTEIIVPDGVNVEIRVSPVFGSIEDNRRQVFHSDVKGKIVVNGTVVMAGIEIRN